jgi:hypothetical protein
MTGARVGVSGDPKSKPQISLISRIRGELNRNGLLLRLLRNVCQRVPEGQPIVAWHEVPGKASLESNRPVGYGMTAKTAVEFFGVAGEFRCFSLHRLKIPKDVSEAG